MTSIGKKAFYECTSLKDVYYIGNKTQWNQISIVFGNSRLKKAKIHYNSIGKIPEVLSPISISKLTASKKEFTVTWQKPSSTVTGFQVQYKLKGSNTAKTITVYGSNATSKKITSLKSKKTYYVKIRSYKKINGKNKYSDWSAQKSIKTM